LSQTLRLPGARVVKERFSPLGLLSAVRSPRAPFRYAPGLSLNSPAAPPEQIGVFTDADSVSVITRYYGEKAPLVYLDYMSSALPYHILDRPATLIIGAGGGTDVLMSLYHDARRVDAVELNPQMIELARDVFGDFAGHVYDDDRVDVHVAEARGFMGSSGRKYDLIKLSHIDSFNASSAGVYALNESYIYTVEALRLYISHLSPGGVLSITRWLKLPPRDTLKMFATVLEALRRSGVAEPGKWLALVRSWNDTTIIVKNGGLAPRDIKAINEFCDKRSFDVAYYPGITKEETNRFNILKEPFLYEGAMALLGEGRGDFIRRYKFDINPASDDRPYFFNFFKWRSAPEFISLIGKGGAPLVEWGYLILVMTLAQAVVASVVFILLPLRALGKTPAPPGVGRKVAAYFFLLGLAFMFIEMAFIQKFILLLSNPIYAVAVILSSLLIFAGIGAGYSARFKKRALLLPSLSVSFTPVEVFAAGIIVIGSVYLFALPHIFHALSSQPDAVKIGVSVSLLAPLAFLMGMPFPLGLGLVSETAPALVPWAWGINGCASVISAALATLLAIHMGFTAVVLLAMLFYTLAAVSIRVLWLSTAKGA